jgi:hypothetical protein
MFPQIGRSATTNRAGTSRRHLTQSVFVETTSATPLRRENVKHAFHLDSDWKRAFQTALYAGQRGGVIYLPAQR